MRSHVWEAALVCLLLMVAAGAFSAWSVVRARARRSAPTVVAAPGGDAVVRAALRAVAMYAPFAMQLDGGGVYVDHATIEKTPIANTDAAPQWLITGQAAADNIDGANFRWSVRVAEAAGQFSAREMQLNGEVIYTAPAKAESAPAT